VINEIAKLAGVDKETAYRIFDKLCMMGINLSECSMKVWVRAVKEAAASL